MVPQTTGIEGRRHAREAAVVAKRHRYAAPVEGSVFTIGDGRLGAFGVSDH
jgi:hypothetical protein